MPLPQEAEQSESLLALQPGGQQPSRPTQVVIFELLQAALQLAALPKSVSMVQAFPSLHVEGQLLSQVSPDSTMPLPQFAEQSLSPLALQPAGQQLSEAVQDEILWWAQTAEQLATAPVSASIVQALPSSQPVGQFPSQVSPDSTIPLPQLAEQSLSLRALQPLGQQPSPSLHAEIGQPGTPAMPTSLAALPAGSSLPDERPGNAGQSSSRRRTCT